MLRDLAAALATGALSLRRDGSASEGLQTDGDLPSINSRIPPPRVSPASVWAGLSNQLISRHIPGPSLPEEHPVERSKPDRGVLSRNSGTHTGFAIP